MGTSCTLLYRCGNNSSNNNQQQSSTFALGQLGSTCNKEGELGWNGFLVGVCKSGKVRYTLATDVPTTPVGGYKSRPTWYPTLAQVLGGPGATEPSCAPSSIKFTKPVIPLDKMAASIPYGMMVGGHVTPIDHAYLGITSLTKDIALRTDADWVPVTAPADGTIIELSSLGSPNTSRVVINHGCNLYSVYMVLNKPSGVLANYVSELASKGSVSLSIKVKAGDEFGRQRDNMLDFNVFDGTQWLSGFANPQAYLSQDAWKPYTADFLPFFSDEIRSGIEKWMQKTTSPRTGKIDWDVIGTASGNWFIDGTNGYGGNQNSLYIITSSSVQTAPEIITGGFWDKSLDGITRNYLIGNGYPYYPADNYYPATYVYSLSDITFPSKTRKTISGDDIYVPLYDGSGYPFQSNSTHYFLIEDDVESSFTVLLNYYDKLYLKGAHNRDNPESVLQKIQVSTIDPAANAVRLIAEASL